MGEYARYNGQEVKIGTCENMYYLRADQARKVTPLPNSVDPVKDAASIRFRFPFPDEDSFEPGSGKFHDANYNRSVAISGVEVPEGVEHSTIQFSSGHGYLVSLPCPESTEGKGFTFHHNGFAGAAHIVQQRCIDGID